MISINYARGKKRITVIARCKLMYYFLGREEETVKPKKQKRRAISLNTSEYASGLKPSKKKRKVKESNEEGD